MNYRIVHITTDEESYPENDNKEFPHLVEAVEDEIDTFIVREDGWFFEARDFIRRITRTYLQVYVTASLDTLKKRDKKGLYVECRSPDSGDVIGVDEKYDVPRNPDVIVDTDQETVAGAIERIIRCCHTKGIL